MTFERDRFCSSWILFSAVPRIVHSLHCPCCFADTSNVLHNTLALLFFFLWERRSSNRFQLFCSLILRAQGSLDCSISFMSSFFRNRRRVTAAEAGFNKQAEMCRYWNREKKKLKVGERGCGEEGCDTRAFCFCFCLSAFLNTINNVSTCRLDQKPGQILCLSVTLHWIWTFGYSGLAAKELHVLYTKIAGSYFNLWELDAFCTTNASLSIQCGGGGRIVFFFLGSS